MKGSIVGLLLMLPLNINAADCSNANIPASTDSANFTINSDGTVVDNNTQLMWMRCSIGQTWNTTSSNCTGSPTLYQWDKALLASSNYSFAGFSDWRLPNINELRSIVEDCRSSPAINRELFPNSPVGKFWSSSTYITNAAQAWLIDFDLGRDNFDLKTRTNALRLVRVKN